MEKICTKHTSILIQNNLMLIHCPEVLKKYWYDSQSTYYNSFPYLENSIFRCYLFHIYMYVGISLNFRLPSLVACLQEGTSEKIVRSCHSVMSLHFGLIHAETVEAVTL